MVSKGIKEVYLTLGEDGVCYGNKKEVRFFPAVEAEAINVTGSGDAFLSGIVHANAMGQWGHYAVMFGIEMAKANCEAEGTVADTMPRLA